MKARLAIEIKTQMGKKYQEGMTVTVNKKTFCLERFQTEGVDDVYIGPPNASPVGKLVRHPTAFWKGFYRLYTSGETEEELVAISKILSSLVYD